MDEKGLKYHKSCGGRVLYREAFLDDPFEQTGFCLDCKQFNIYEEDIIFYVKKEQKYEIFNDDLKKWQLLEEEELPLTLHHVKHQGKYGVKIV